MTFSWIFVTYDLTIWGGGGIELMVKAIQWIG